MEEEEDDGVMVCSRSRSAISDPSDLVQLARQIVTADEFVRCRAVGKMGVIAAQMKSLHEQARIVLEEARRDAHLHHVSCNMQKVPGTVYYLYSTRDDDDDNKQREYLSIIAPNEWGMSKNKRTFLGAFRLEFDRSWTPIDRIDQRDQEVNLLLTVLNTQHNTFTLSALENKDN